MLGVRIHNLKNQNGATCAAGGNPFAAYYVNGSPLTNWAKVYDPAGVTSQQVYDAIANNIDTWVEEAIRLRRTV